MDGTELKPVLERVGIRDAFVPLKADFDHMASSKEGLHVSKVVQKATIDVVFQSVLQSVLQENLGE